MTEEELQAIREREAKATPGPWRGLYLSGDFVTGVRNSGAPIGLAEEPFTTADKSFICHAREDIPALLAEVERLHERLADMARDTIVAFALEVSSDDPTIEKAKQILRDMGREEEIPDY